MSVFLALDLDDAVRARVTSLIDEHRAALSAKWLRADKLHVTLVFLGNATPQQVDTFVPRIDALAWGRAPFSLRLQGAGTFVTARAPSVLWLGVEGQLDALAALHHEATESLGGGPERDREWAPHLTLARAKQPSAFDALQASLRDFVTPQFQVRHVSLYESTHDQYRVLHRAGF
jgi:2'-5' RNA ligase